MSQSQWSIWVLAARPKTLPAAAAPVIIGTAMAYQIGGFHFLSALAALCSAMFIQIGTNLANDYFDYKKGTDREDRLGPTRVTQAGLVSPKAVKIATIVAFSIAFLIGIYLVFRGGLPIVIIGLSSILFGVLYTGGPYPIGYIGLGEIFVLLFFGPVAVGGTYYAQTLTITNDVLIAGLAPGLFSVAILVVNNLRDIVSDRQTGKKTLAVRLGITFSKIEYCISILTALFLLFYFYNISENIYHLLPILIIVPAIFAMRIMFTKTGSALNDLLALTGKLLFIYAILFAIGWIV